MTSWNYRIIKKLDTDSGEAIYQVHEVYYSANGSIECWNDAPVEPMGTNPAGLRNDIQAFLSAFRLPALEQKHLHGKAVLEEEVLPIAYPESYSDYVQKIERASSYINQILGNNLLLKKDPALRQAFSKVDQALHDLKLLAGPEQAHTATPAKISVS